MKAYHVLRRTLERPYALRSGMKLLFKCHGHNEIFKIRSQSLGKDGAHYTGACSSNIVLTVNGENSMYYYAEDQKEIVYNSWEPGLLLGSLPNNESYYPVGRIEKTKELCINIPTIVSIKEPVRVKDILTDDKGADWTVEHITVDNKVILIDVLNRDKSAVLFPQDKEMAAKYNVEFTDEDPLQFSTF
ncbi:hypothetical protein NCTGTJJY_CDS0093 [Serratia phage 92A1]|nr:hypothetical protein NCTGTJJY_CDS0093 [Serratia phage 92A1]